MATLDTACPLLNAHGHLREGFPFRSGTVRDVINTEWRFFEANFHHELAACQSRCGDARREHAEEWLRKRPRGPWIERCFKRFDNAHCEWRHIEWIRGVLKAAKEKPHRVVREVSVPIALIAKEAGTPRGIAARLILWRAEDGTSVFEPFPSATKRYDVEFQNASDRACELVTEEKCVPGCRTYYEVVPLEGDPELPLPIGGASASAALARALGDLLAERQWTDPRVLVIGQVMFEGSKLKLAGVDDVKDKVQAFRDRHFRTSNRPTSIDTIAVFSEVNKAAADAAVEGWIPKDDVQLVPSP